jgi:hypothetical protein
VGQSRGRLTDPRRRPSHDDDLPGNLHGVSLLGAVVSAGQTPAQAARRSRVSPLSGPVSRR